jgi:hypothetical protein
MEIVAEGEVRPEPHEDAWRYLMAEVAFSYSQSVVFCFHELAHLQHALA